MQDIPSKLPGIVGEFRRVMIWTASALDRAIWQCFLQLGHARVCHVRADQDERRLFTFWVWEKELTNWVLDVVGMSRKKPTGLFCYSVGLRSVLGLLSTCPERLKLSPLRRIDDFGGLDPQETRPEAIQAGQEG
jgi:hypothetical protein